jgi:hypothetical protein
VNHERHEHHERGEGGKIHRDVRDGMKTTKDTKKHERCGRENSQGSVTNQRLTGADKTAKQPQRGENLWGVRVKCVATAGPAEGMEGMGADRLLD